MSSRVLLLYRNVEEIVKDAYAWLAGKYQEGDQIYLFGWLGSRLTYLQCPDEADRFLSGRISSEDSSSDDIRSKLLHCSPDESHFPLIDVITRWD